MVAGGQSGRAVSDAADRPFARGRRPGPANAGRIRTHRLLPAAGQGGAATRARWAAGTESRLASGLSLRLLRALGRMVVAGRPPDHKRDHPLLLRSPSVGSNAAGHAVALLRDQPRASNYRG